MNPRLSAITLALAASASSHAALITPQAISQARQAGTLQEYRVFGASNQFLTIGAWFKSVCAADFTSYADDQADPRHWSYACTLGQAVGPHAPGTLVLVNKRNNGSAIFGVNPVATNSPQNALLVAGPRCVATGLEPDVNVAAYACTGLVTARAHAGISDFEPARYSDEVTRDGVQVTINLNGGTDDAGQPWTTLTGGEINSLDTRTIMQVVYGVGVNLALRNALQQAQGLLVGSELEEDRPSVPGGFYAAAVAGFVQGGSPNATWRSLTGLAGDEAKQVNLCRQADGAPSQIATNLFFLKAGALLSDANGMLAPLGALGSLAAYGSLAVAEVGPSPELAQCLTDAALGKDGYAMGVLPLTLREDGEGWRYARLDGMAPSKDAARTGAYPLVYAATMQFKKSGWLTETQRQFLVAMRNGIATPATISGVPVAAFRGGWLANPTTYSATCAGATGIDRQHGSCVERLDRGSAFNANTYLNGESEPFATNSKQPLHMVK